MQLLKILAVDLGEKRNRRSDRKAPVNGRLNKKIYFLLNNTIHFNTYRDEDTIHIYKGVYTFLQISVLNIPFRLVQPPPPRTHTHAPTHTNTRQDRKKRKQGWRETRKKERCTERKKIRTKSYLLWKSVLDWTAIWHYIQTCPSPKNFQRSQFACLVSNRNMKDIV